MKHLGCTPLSVLVAVTFSVHGSGQLIVGSVHNLGQSSTFGHNDLPALARSNAAHLAPAAKPSVPWKQAVARIAAGQESGDKDYHKQATALELQINDLKHASGAIGYLEERAVNKLQADIDEVDHLIVRRHLLTDKHAENEKDIATIESHVAALSSVAANLIKTGNAEEEAAVNHEVSDLSFAADSLKGKVGEVQELSHEIEATTADGRKMDKQVRHLARERKAIGRQVRVLTQEGDEIKDSEETAHDFEAFEKAGYDGIDDKDDPYLKEAAEAMERASGWNKDDLDAEAIKRREMMTKGLSADPGQAVKAMKAMRGSRLSHS